MARRNERDFDNRDWSRDRDDERFGENRPTENRWSENRWRDSDRSYDRASQDRGYQAGGERNTYDRGPSDRDFGDRNFNDRGFNDRGFNDRNLDNRDYERTRDYREQNRNYMRDDDHRGTSMGGWSSSPSTVQGYQGYNDTSFGDGDTGRYRDRNYYQRTDWDRTQPTHERFSDKVRRFFGKGPKGYKRSDERIKEDVCDRLSEGWIDASDIEINVSEGEVTLTGFVDERRMKHVAEDLAERVAGVQDVHNHLRVRKAGAQTKTGTQDVRPTMSSSTVSNSSNTTTTPPPSANGTNGRKNT